MDEKNLTDGFNSGYYLAKEKPELLKTLLNGVTGNSDYLDGLKAGQNEYMQEEYARRMNEHMNQKDKAPDKDRGR